MGFCEVLCGRHLFQHARRPGEVIMLDTRSGRDNARRNECETMWSDSVTTAKDSWGTRDTPAREEIFNGIETEQIGGVLLVSGDRHGARGFTIPRRRGSLSMNSRPPASAERPALSAK